MKFLTAVGLICIPLALTAQDATAQETPAVLGPKPQACTAGAQEPAALVHVSGFKDRSGNIRVELYPAVDGDFLTPGSRLRAEGKVFQRIDNPMPERGDVEVCIPLPGIGPFAISVLHDRNGNGKLDVFNDGYGFPNNPRLGLSKPSAAEATFQSSAGVTRIDVVLNYWNGLAARPLRNPPSSEQAPRKK